MEQSPSWQSDSRIRSSLHSPPFMEARRFIAMFTRPHLCLSSGIFHSCYLTLFWKVLMFLIFPMHTIHAWPFHPPWFDHPYDIWWRVQTKKLLIEQFYICIVWNICYEQNHLHYSTIISLSHLSWILENIIICCLHMTK